jgi:hypothetical protein
MKNIFMKIRGERKGSALLVAMLIMAILMTITLGLSALVVGEIRRTADVVAAGKAYYAAEAGTENALLDLHEHLPGYQTTNVLGNVDGWIESAKDDNLNYRYRIKNQGNSYPYFDPDKPVFLQPGVGIKSTQVKGSNPQATYNILPLHQTVTIPLFVDCGDGTYGDIDFMLQYYVNFKVDTTRFQVADGGDLMSKFDILRWKLFGQPLATNVPADQVGRTDAISDFYPVTGLAVPKNPVCIGSNFSMLDDDPNYTCIALAVDTFGDLPDTIDFSGLSQDDIITSTFENSWGAARECYTTDSGLGNEGEPGIQKNCSMSAFMEQHTRNYLTITNVVSPQIVGITNPTPEEQAAKANIYYRVIAAKKTNGHQCSNSSSAASSEDIMVREYADISSDGYASNKGVTQSIDAKLKLNSFLPVFNFTLFRTDPNSVDPDLQSTSDLVTGL